MLHRLLHMTIGLLLVVTSTAQAFQPATVQVTDKVYAIVGATSERPRKTRG
ncbi:MAG: hypothetical protein R3E89_10270 [Thiolinea sp.]